MLLSVRKAGNTMRGAAAPLPDPRRGEADAREFLRVFGLWSDKREKTLSEWASNLDDLIKQKAATCAELHRYNQAAMQLFANQSMVRIKLVLAGADPKEVEAPPYPTLFAEEVRVSQPSQGAFEIAYKLPCPAGATYPEFSRLKVWGPPLRTAGAATASLPFPTSTLAGPFGALPILIATWAGRILLAGIIAWATVSVIEAFSTLWSDKEVTDIHRAILAEEAERDRDRAQFVNDCVQKSDGSREAIDACQDAGQRTFPPREIQPNTGGAGRFVLLAGLAALAIFGGLAWYSRAKSRD